MGNLESERYREMAERCERAAETLPDAVEKRQFKELAQQWRELAKQAASPGEEEPRG
jgi:methionyl-tRNA synthetase